MEGKIMDGINAVKQVYPDARFIIFGSEANDSATKDSDIDICVIFPEIEKDSFALAAELATEIRKYLDRALDVIVVDESNFDKRSRETWTLEHIIKSEGIAV
ncbi:MAG: nucleotidyltransferase domain-containing protein [Candidatus Heimdallarchaeota archaeon]|nr:nucleotidyltransferase domain-containing protein [Candidatus Heimdallarchaeota archaeon]